MRLRLLLAFAATAGDAIAAPPQGTSVPAQVYTDARRGFSIAYPQGWTVDPSFADKGYGFFQGETDDVRGGVAFRPTYDLAPGSNLESDQLQLVVQRARPGDLCVADSFLVDPPPDYATEEPVKKPEVVHTMAEPGDLYTMEQVVLIASKAPCLAVHYYIYYRRPTAPDPKPPFDRKGLFALLDAIAGTVKPLK